MRKATVAVLLILLVTALVGTPLFSQGAAAQGRSFRGSMDNSASFDISVPTKNALLWSYQTGDQIQSSPVPYGGKVFFGSNNGNLYAVDAVRGSLVWSLELGGQVMASPTIGDDGTIYIGCTNHTFFAVDSSSGEVQWRWTVPDPYAQIVSSATLDEQNVYFGASDKHIYALNLTTHKEAWNFTVKGDVWASPAVYGPRIYIGSLDGQMYSIWKGNGTLAWNFSTKGYEGIYASAAVADGKVVFVTGQGDECVWALDAVTGKVVWCFRAPGPGYGSAAIDNGTVYIPTWDRANPGGKLFALPLNDPTPGDGILENSSIKWSAFINDVQGGSSAVYSRGSVLVGSDDGMGGEGKLLCFNSTTGKMMWNLTTGGDVYSSPGLQDGVAFVGSLDGRMYAVGGDPNATMVVKVIPEAPTIQGGHVIGISFQVTYRGLPMEGAFIKVNVTAGELSQNGASTFPDGSQRIKYQAPKVAFDSQVTFTAEATFFGIETAHGSAVLNISKASGYTVSSSSSIALANYIPYFVIIIILVVVNVVLFVLGRRLSAMKEVPKDGK